MSDKNTANAAPTGMVRIRCTSDRRPWTDTKPLEKGEVVDVTPEVAAILKGKTLAEDAKGAPLGLPAEDGERMDELLS